MFDDRRLDTLGAINDGVLLRGAVPREAPDGRESVEPGDWESPGPAAEIIAALNAGKVVKALNYYGIPEVWRDDDGRYRGRLLQYCNVTEREEWATAAEAAEWFVEMWHRTNG